MKGKKCDTCNLPIPDGRFEPLSIACSEYHIRCVRCNWPVAKSIMDEDMICGLCKGKKQ